MTARRLLALASLLGLAALPASAQLDRGQITIGTDTINVRQRWLDTTVGQRVEGVFDQRDSRSRLKYDTTYIAKPAQRWTLKLRSNVSGSNFYVKRRVEGDQHDAKLYTSPKVTIGASATYRGITLGVALNPAKFAGKNKDFEFNLNSYGNRMGADVVYLAANTYHGTTTTEGHHTDVPVGAMSMKMFTASAYYAFNYRHFSFPAAFTQSQLQLRSCGTWLVAASVLKGSLDASAGILNADGTGDTSLKLFHAGLGGGYAYNLVTRHNWLIHASATPQIIFLEHNKMSVDGTRRNTPFRFPNIIYVGRMAAVHHWGNRFIGASAVINAWNLGDYDELHAANVKWRVRLFYGFRFGM